MIHAFLADGQIERFEGTDIEAEARLKQYEKSGAHALHLFKAESEAEFERKRRQSASGRRRIGSSPASSPVASPQLQRGSHAGLPCLHSNLVDALHRSGLTSTASHSLHKMGPGCSSGPPASGLFRFLHPADEQATCANDPNPQWTVKY